VSRRASGNPPSLDARRFSRDAQLKLVEQNDCKEKDCENRPRRCLAAFALVPEGVKVRCARLSCKTLSPTQ
jgi:hypothetical protein